MRWVLHKNGRIIRYPTGLEPTKDVLDYTTLREQKDAVKFLRKRHFIKHPQQTKPPSKYDSFLAPA